LDDDEAGLAFGTTAITTSETATLGATTVSFTVSLETIPISEITLNILHSDPSEGSLSTSSLTFSAGDWNVLQTATVTGVDDINDDGNIVSSVDFFASSADGFYSAVVLPIIVHVNQDDEVSGVSVAVTSITTDESAGEATLTFVLDCIPYSAVTMNLAHSDSSEGTLSTTSLTFTTTNWHVIKTITVTGEDDHVDDGDIEAQVVVTLSSGDSNYDGLAVESPTVSNLDDDLAGYTMVLDSESLRTAEGVGTATFTLVIDSEPTSDVSFDVEVDDSSEGELSAGTLTFTSANWDTAQAVTLTGIDDSLDDGDNYESQYII
jgi:hypothetical protein